MQATDRERQLRAYRLLWCAQWLVTLFRYHDVESPELWMTPLVIVCMVRRGKAPLAVAHAAFVATKAWRQPFQYNSDIWIWMLDLAVLVGGSSAVRPMLALFYASAGFWKLNTSHLAATTSCSVIFYTALVDEYLPASFETKTALAARLAVVAGASTATLEMSIGLLFLVPWSDAHRVAALLGVALHSGIALSPPPNNVCVFSAMAVARYFFAAPESVARALEAGLQRASRYPAVVAALVACFACAAPRSVRSPAGFVFVAIASIMLVAFTSGWTKNEPSKATTVSWAHWSCVLFAFLYAFLLVPLGLQDMGNCHMFSNLRVAGSGGNHLLVPTGLCQTWWPDGTGPFAGGVVRIDSTTNSHLKRMYPCDLSHELSGSARRVLRSIGHSAREFIPLEARVYGVHVCGTIRDDVAYATHAFELRRLVGEARARRDRGFSITYARLGHDVDWTTALTAGEKLRFAVDGNGTETCVVLESGEPCDPSAPSQLPWPPTGPRLPIWLLTKLLVFNPQPLLPSATRPWEMECADG